MGLVNEIGTETFDRCTWNIIKSSSLFFLCLAGVG